MEHKKWLEKADEYKVADLHKDIYQSFKKQDYENDLFDVIFHVQGKELYAHAHILAAASPVFKEQLLKNRAKGNPPIQIDDYTYDEFFAFLSCIYYDCFQVFYYPYNDLPSEKKIFAIAQLVDVYEAERIKEFCKRYEFDFYTFNAEEIFESIVLAQKFSVGSNNRSLEDQMEEHFYELIAWNGFINLDKSAIKAFAKCVVWNDYKSESYAIVLFDAIYKWGTHQAMLNDEMPEEEKNELVLHQIVEMLPLFSLQFLLEVVVPKGIISAEEAKEYKTTEIVVYSGDKSLTGTFVDGYKIFEFIKDAESDEEIKFYDNGRRCVWHKKFKVPSTPSKLKKIKRCEWYLLFDNRKLSIKHQKLVKSSDYLISEMKEMDEGEFLFKKKKNEEGKEECDFYATVSRKNDE